MPHQTKAEIVVTPFANEEKRRNFGATITGVDLNNLDEESFQALREAVYRHSVVVIKDQHGLQPAKQFELVRRFDPEATPKHGFGGKGKGAKELGEALGKNPFYVIPGSGGVTIVGNGYQGENHYGLENVTLKAMSHVDYHDDPLSAEDFENGQARFNIFHFDGIIYGAHPSRITTFRCVKLPQGPDLTIRWDDAGTERVMQCQPGCTAFISGAQLYSLLTDNEKMMVDNSFWEPAPYPFAWSGSRKIRSGGLGLASGGKTIPLDELPEWTSDKVHKYPMVWLNPVTGEKSLQIMAEVVRKVFLKETPNGVQRTVEDEEEIRVWLNGLLDRIAKTEYILVPRVEEGDMVVWNNWGVIHSGIEYPLSYGPRTAHQCHIASSTAPVGPTV
ncbi:Clavaminate synthase-like protein [Mollisia scopiformis]|uniref:Clavaminate synthase-like protein n=1 Tax=Mollisia scopiformis TaxID=149040 RepID=A0A194XUP6_MOLSC|nr:Clavaminate synthase-like protein [Mollisia scopiformis]KUJ23861.1 Clavaminate synthase-like protein [Mollisia scopiformis]